MNIWRSIVLAIIQGITEFLPVSSSAHLVIIPKLFNWSDQGLAFDIALHLGTLTAVLFYFRKDLIALANPFYHLTQKIILATIPACIIGFLIKDYIEPYHRSTLVIAANTIIFGLILGLAQLKEKNSITNFAQITYTQALIIGLAQCLAMLPGASRLGTTITAALLLGMPRKLAAKFSFLISIPIIGLSALMVAKDIIKDPSIINISLYYYLLGFIVTAAVAMLSIHIFMKILNKVGLMPFVIYRLLLGVFLLAYFY
jgi:undecaprenyl-diphosphatase